MLILFVVTSLVLISCSEGKVSFIGVDEVVWNFDFSRDGQHAFLISGWYKLPSENGYDDVPPLNSIRSFSTTKLSEEMKVIKPQGEAAHVFTCGNPAIVIVAETDRDDPFGSRVCCSVLNFRDSNSGKTVGIIKAPHYWGHGVTAESNTSFYRCIPSNDMIYMWIDTDTISAIDISGGSVVRNYFAQDVGESWSFELQEDADRLLLFDVSNDRIWVFRLSTGERLGVVELGEGHPPYEWVSLIDCVIADTDHVVCTALEQLANGDYLTQLFLVDLAGPTIERTYPLGKYIIYEQPPTPMPGGKVITLGRNLTQGPYYEYHEVLVTDLATGETTVPYRNYDYGWMKAFPELSVVRITGGEGVGTPNTWWVYSFPEFELLKSGPQPIPTGDGVYLPKRKLFLSMAFGEMTVFDMQEYKFLDKLRMCDGADYWFRVDATERYAGVLCHGTENHRDVVGGIRPKGAGVAVLDLSRYFSE
jgi:hypothetical protein